MSSRRLLWQLFPAFVLIALVALLAVTWVMFRALDQFNLEQTQVDLESRARLVSYHLGSRTDKAHSMWVDDTCKELGRRTSTRITVILADGQVLGDSDSDPQRMDNHAMRPEIRQALTGSVGLAVRFSVTLGQRLVYVALPLSGEKGTVAVVRTAVPLRNLNQTQQAVLVRLGGGGLLVLFLAALLSLWQARRLSRPLEQMKVGAQRFADGDLTHNLPLAGSEEAQSLAAALNHMARQLDTQIRSELRQRSEIEAVLASMTEGVLAVDGKECFLRCNAAAASLFNLDAGAIIGQPLRAALRMPELHRAVELTLQSSVPIEEELILYGVENRYLQLHGSRLLSEGSDIGALLVFNDVTGLRRLESIRRDFVANVSHELKTPITAIKGFVETLLDGALDNRQDAERFLTIVQGQSDRLNAIIDDLLDLSRIEQGVEEGGLPLEWVHLGPVLSAARVACSQAAQDAEIEIKLTCPADLGLKANAPLLEQAVVNLLTNAVKYSPAGSFVDLFADSDAEEIVIRVRDRGCGIAADHLPRLFERFYRVDRARSRKLGGTGLGLAIVKHIAQVHGGRVAVESTPGEGSLFTIHLPGG